MYFIFKFSRFIFRGLKLIYLLIKYLFIIIFYYSLNRKTKLLIVEDLYAWNKFGNNKTVIFDLILFLENRKFQRNLFYHRISNRFFVRFIKIFLKEERLFHINSISILGSGIRLSHPYNSFINAVSVGDNVEILHNVTIGFNGKDFNAPVIGNNVLIGCGAVIIGGITIGNNVNIGSNCVVTKDVPSNCTIIGNPSRIVRKDGEKVYIKL